jgi:hypothetical protein
VVTPAIVLAVALYSMARATGLVGTTAALVIAHTVLALPFVVLNVGVSLDGLDRRLLLAAAGLGASDLHIFRTVTLPLIAPGVVGGAVFAFVTSFDEVVLSIFLAGPTVKTLPVRIWEEIRLAYTPVVARRGDRDAAPRFGRRRGESPAPPEMTREYRPVRRDQQVVRSGGSAASDGTRYSAGRIPHAVGTFRIRQDDVAQHLRRLPGADGGPPRCWRTRHYRPPAAAAQHGDGVPELCVCSRT